MGCVIGGRCEEVTWGLVEFEGQDVLMEAETLLSIADGCDHCYDEIRSSTGSRTEKAKAAGGKSQLADEDCRGWDQWLVEEGGKEDGYDIFNVGCEGGIPFLPFWVWIIDW